MVAGQGIYTIPCTTLVLKPRNPHGTISCAETLTFVQCCTAFYESQFQLGYYLGRLVDDCGH